MKEIPFYKYFKHKYGQELLVDVIHTDDMLNNIRRTPVYITNFYSIILFTSGDEELTVNEHTMKVHKGVAVCSRPGEVWKWNQHTQLQGLHLLFEEEFLFSFFNDPLFLNKFPYLQADRSSSFLQPDEELFNRILHLYKEMQAEIKKPGRVKDQHILRAMLYETLMLYNRAPQVVSEDSSKHELAMLRYIKQFQQLVETHYITQHDVDYYAEYLCITPNYLNKIVKHTLGNSTKQYILSRIMTEAKRWLSYTSLSVAEIAEKLNFDTSSYFVRLFRRLEGVTPNQYRNKK
jgi:AraC family transcriptional activator of pobA